MSIFTAFEKIRKMVRDACALVEIPDMFQAGMRKQAGEIQVECDAGASRTKVLRRWNVSLPVFFLTYPVSVYGSRKHSVSTAAG